jgi:hypothetical protein
VNRLPAALIVALVCLVPASAAETIAKAPNLTVAEALQPGGTVRVQSSESEVRLTGTIKSLEGDRLVIVNRKGEETAIPWSTVRRLEVGVGVRHTFGAAAAIGGFAGALAGAVMPNKEPCYAPGCPDETTFSRGEAVLAGGAVGALLGVCAEAISKPRGTKWTPVPLPYAPVSAIGFRIAPLRDGVAAGLRWTF